MLLKIEKHVLRALAKYERRTNSIKEIDPVSAFHSLFIYGKQVETCRPYSYDYMKNNI